MYLIQKVVSVTGKISKLEGLQEVFKTELGSTY